VKAAHDSLKPRGVLGERLMKVLRIRQQRPRRVSQVGQFPRSFGMARSDFLRNTKLLFEFLDARQMFAFELC
jgi:hypothetical protein